MLSCYALHWTDSKSQLTRLSESDVIYISRTRPDHYIIVVAMHGAVTPRRTCLRAAVCMNAKATIISRVTQLPSVLRGPTATRVSLHWWGHRMWSTNFSCHSCVL